MLNNLFYFIFSLQNDSMHIYMYFYDILMQFICNVNDRG